MHTRRRSRRWLGTALAVSCLLALGGAAAHASTPDNAPATCRTPLDLAKLNVPGLSVGVVKDGRLMCTAVAGHADIEHHRKVEPDTTFLVASVTKTVTATALMQLFDAGKFRLDDDINAQLGFAIRSPHCPDKPVTYRQLLTHTSPIKDYKDLDKLPIDQLLPGDSTVPVASYLKSWLVPGGSHYTKDNFYPEWCTRPTYHYTNLGFVVAGELVQHITHRGLDEYAREHIFEPLGMNDTSYFLRCLDRARIAMPYTNTPPGKFKPLWQYGELDWPDGMIRTSVPQLARFLIAFSQYGEYRGARILNRSTAAEMRRVQFPNSNDDNLKRQGLAWYYENLEGDSAVGAALHRLPVAADVDLPVLSPKLVLGHNGQDNGASAMMFFNPANRTGVILMANGDWYDEDGDSPEADRLAVALLREAGN